MPKVSDIILDEHAVALNDLLLACLRSENHFSRAVKLLEEKCDTAALFEAIRHRRQGVCDSIKSIIRAMNHLPKEPDPDREMVADLATRAKILLSENGKINLLQKAAQLEMELEKHLDNVLKLDWPGHIEEKLEHIRGSLHADKGRIDGMIASSV